MESLTDRLQAQTPLPLASTEESHAKLQRNLSLALDLHREILSSGFSEEMPAGRQRIGLEAASQTVKAALTVDRTALKARQDDVFERCFIRMLAMSRAPLSSELATILKRTPREKLEASLSSEDLAAYDAKSAA